MTHLFFPVDDESDADRDEREELACTFCDTCPVLAQCNELRLTRRCAGAVMAGVRPYQRRRRRKIHELEALQPGPLADPTDIIVYEHQRALDAEIRQYQMSFDTAV